MTRRAWINQPVVDLRRTPTPTKHILNDSNQETQLLFGCEVWVREEENGFSYVESTDQPYCLNGKWTGYPGWVDTQALGRTPPTQAAAPHPSPDRKRVIAHAKTFLDSPYFWGGCSSPDLGGVDCSGLVYLSYRSIGVTLPRNAHDQYLVCPDTNELREGDLVFLDTGASGRIDHVMLYIGEGVLLEATGITKNVRTICLDERIDSLPPEDQVFFKKVID